MIKQVLPLSALLGALIATATSVQASIVINETWADGERATQDLANNSMAWYTSSSGTSLTAAVGSMTQTTGTGGRHTLGYFTNAGSPVELAVGEAIRLNFTVSFPAYVGANTSFGTNQFKVGLLNSVAAVNRVDADNQGGTNTDPLNAGYNEKFVPYTGYIFNGRLTTGTQVLQKRPGDLISGGALIVSAAPYTALGSNLPALSSDLLPATAYNGTLTIERKADTTTVSYKFMQGATTLFEGSRDDASGFSSFDTVAFSMGSNVASGFALQQVEISIIPVEEPPEEQINEMTTGDNLGTGSNWSLGSAPTNTANDGSHRDLLFTTSSTALVHSFADVFARSYNVTNGTAYTIWSNRAADQSTGTRFRAGSTADSSTTFTNLVSAVENDLVFLANDSSLFFDGVNPVEGGPAPTFPLQNSGNFNISAGSTLEIGMPITGGRNLTITGIGETILSGDNTYSGATTIRNGVLEISGANATSRYELANDVDNPEGTAPRLRVSAVDALPAAGVIRGSNSIARAGIVEVAAAGSHTTGTYDYGTITFTNSSGGAATLTFTAPSKITRGGDAGRTFTNDSADLSIVFASTLEIGSSNPGHATFDTAGDITVQGDLISPGDGVRELRKRGDGTLRVDGTSFYTGDTILTAGTLSFASPNTNNDASTVSIAAEATLDLDFVGTDTVDKLIIGGIQQPAGVYGAVDVPQITGTGTLTVVSDPVGFAAWQYANSAAGGFAADHDSDGVPNGVEYFLGGPDGDTTGFTPLPEVVDASGVLSITWTKGPGYAGVYGVDFWVETSATLEADSWTVETVGVGVTIDGDDVTFTFPAPLGDKQFARLNVVGP